MDDVQRLYVALGQVSRRLRAVSVGSDGMTFMEFAVLHRLARSRQSTMAELARGERVTSQSLVPVVARLQERGLVESTPDVDDLRRIQLSVSRRGQRLLASRQEATTNRLGVAVSALSKDEQARLMRAVPLIERVAEAL